MVAGWGDGQPLRQGASRCALTTLPSRGWYKPSIRPEFGWERLGVWAQRLAGDSPGDARGGPAVRNAAAMRTIAEPASLESCRSSKGRESSLARSFCIVLLEGHAVTPAISRRMG